MNSGHLPNIGQLDRWTRHLDPPFAAIDARVLAGNTEELVRRAAGKPVRVATKSVRVRSVIERTLAHKGYRGVMAYSLGEANWLADCGFDDILLAYPTTHCEALRDLAAQEHRARAITLMVDDAATLDLIDLVLGANRPSIRVCLEADASLRLGALHFGVRRSPVRTAGQATALAREVTGRPGFELVGVMFYEAQIAGLPDSSPVIRRLKARSAAELADRRRDVVTAVSAVAPLALVNGGGTGSLEVTAADGTVTELTAGSGLFAPTLFDRYDAFDATPAAYFALPVVRRPAPDIATLYGGGYIGSGPSKASRQPTPVWPPGLKLIGTEGAGEVQTPVRGDAARSLRIGDRVWFRHAKAGEMCERFDAVHLVGPEGIETLPTYRGEHKDFG